MSKKKETKEFTVKDSMIFQKSDRTKHEKGENSKKMSKAGKIILTCFIAAAILFVGVPLLIVMLFGNKKPDYTNDGVTTLTYSEMVAMTEATDKSTEILALKNPDLNDAEAVKKLIATLKPEEKLGGYSVEIQSAEKPYSITLKFNLSHDLGEDAADKWNTTVIKYSTAILCLCDNVAQVNWEYPVNDGKDGAFFNRADAEKYLNLSVEPSQLAASSESVQLMLSLLGIDIY